jgi:lipopolysaccharide/colanic/teichoic acid biosynthesis glycosyltransferase
MLLLMWLVGCALVALESVALQQSDGPWLLGLAAVMVAQGAVLARRAARLPPLLTWPIALASVAAYAVAYGLVDHLAFLALALLLMLLVDRFAILSVGLSAFLLNDSAAGTRMLRSATLAPPDPIARDFARVRRERSRLTVASIALGGRRASARRLAEVARALVPCLRVTDAIVRAAADGIVVVLPGADERVALNVLGRMSAAKRRDLVLGTATFPDDGQTYALLKDVARSRRRPWLDAGGDGPSSNGHDDREARAGRPQQPADRPAVLFEARTLSIPLRRGVDLLVLLLIAPIVIPVVALLALAVKLDSPGPAFVRIDRLGRDGRPFGLLKLRSMTRDADRMKEELRHLNTMAWPDFKIADDPRVTRLGRVLRKSSLDELPQLHNVLRGEMTLVGPRPCSVKLADYDLWQSERLDVTPGLVGRWQAEGRGTMDFAERCRLDIRQARSRSIRVNLQLVLATIRSVFISRGAY